MEKQYFFTIITVCYNAEKYIEKTIQSLLEQNFKDYEYIIKDGASKDGTMNIVNKLLKEDDNFHILSAPDKGIYDAMNQAIEMAKGKYIYFLNAGDCFAAYDVLQKTYDFIRINQGDIVYGNVIQNQGEHRMIRKYGRICSNKYFFLTGDCICHQALFAHRDTFKEKTFDLKYKVCADKDWELFHISGHATLKPMGFEVASILVDGFAREHVNEFEQETRQCIDYYCVYTSWIYKLLMIVKKNKVILRLLRWIESSFFKSKI